MKRITTKSVLFFSILFIGLLSSFGTVAQCVTLQYQGSGLINAGTTCAAPLIIPTQDLSLSVNPPCTIVAPLTFSGAKDLSTNQTYLSGASVPAGATIQMTYLAAINDGVQVQIVPLIFEVKIVETAAPTLFGIPSAVTINCNPSNPPTNIIATDNCDNNPVLNMIESGSANACINGGLITRTWTATDKSGNKTTATQNITVQKDVVGPVLTQLAVDNVVTCESWVNELNAWLQNRANSAATDNCSANVTFLINNIARTQAQIIGIFQDSINKNTCRNNVNIGGTPYNKVKASITVGFVYNDPCGNLSAVTLATFAARDLVAPTITRAASDLTIQCDTANINSLLSAWINRSGGAVFSDGCSSSINNRSVPTLAQALVALAGSQNNSCGNTGKVEVSFIGADNCGNEATSVATFTVIDTNKPKINKVAKSKVYQCRSGLADSLSLFVNSHAGAVASDGCSAVNWSYTWKEKNAQTGNSPSLPTIKSGCSWYADFNFTVRDECNNTETVSARFTVKDSIAPVFTNLPTDLTIKCDGNIPAAPTVTATDACSNGAVVSYKGETSTLNNGCNGNYFLVRTWEAVDSCGNKSTHQQNIKVVDSNAPTISNVPANITVNCNTIPNLPPNDVITASDLCDANPLLSFSETFTKGNDPNLCNFYNYTITRRWTTSDKCGNSASSQQVITVRDDSPPSFTVPNDVTVECQQANNITFTGYPDEVYDECNTRPTITYSDVQKGIIVTCNSKGLIERTWKVSDGCNEVQKKQFITSQDTEAPKFNLDPDDITLNCGVPLPDYNITALDSCDLSVQNNPGAITQEILIDFTNCSGNYSLVRSWIVSDNCLNESRVSQKVTYIDIIPPRIVTCPNDFTVNNTPNSCDAPVILVAPVVEDNCESYLASFSKIASSTVSSSSPGSVTQPVNDVDLNFNFMLTPAQSLSNVRLKIDLKNMDAEDPLEYFNILGEDGSNLGKTLNTPNQCGASSTLILSLTAAQIYSWAADGVVKIKLKPNLPVNTAFAINDICANAQAEGLLTFSFTTFTNTTFSYKINNGALINAPLSNISRVLPTGRHKVSYYVKDCSNNTDSCSYNITILDAQKPTMYPPADKTYFLLTASGCDTLAMIFPPTGFSDNCGSFGSTYYQKQLANGDSLLRFNYDPNYLTNFANDAVLTFTDVTLSSLSNNAVLQIKLKAKASASDAYFDIYGEGNTFLGRTTVASCSNTGTTNLTITPAQLNLWAADGKIEINAIRFKGIPIGAAGTNPGINACALPLDNGKDNVSWMTASLTYNTANPDYYITGATQVAPKPFFKAGVIQRERFKRGMSVVHFTLADAAGNRDTVSYKVNVNDFVNPVARCKNAIVAVNPFTSTATAFTPDLIDRGSTDNCGIASLSVFPFAYGCADAGQVKSVTLTVRDSSGRQNSCVASIFVDNVKVLPSYKLGICGNDTLQLFSNPPVTPSDAFYLYKWTGPNGFVSTERDPKIPNVISAYAGTYQVTVTNPFASCDVMGLVTIPISNVPNTPILSVSNTKPCANSELILSTQNYNGKNPNYKWYTGDPSSRVLIDSTKVASFSILNPKDTVKYFVQVTVDGCISNESAPITVFPIKPLTATTTNPALIEICEGENIALGTAQTGLGYSFQWTGPNGFTENTPYPSVITNARTLNSGLYTLIISSNGCESAPVTTVVNVKPKPATPLISSNGRDCEGATINLVTNITGASSYLWIKPDFSEEPSQRNFLVLNALAADKKGEWRVAAIKDGCRSENSLPISILVNPKPVVTASYISPVCDGSSLTLNGTAPMGSSYIWTSGTSTIGASQNITVVAQSGNYTLSSIAPNGCDNSFTISVTTVPAPQITVVTSNATPCVTGSTDAKLVPTVSPFNVDLGYTYQWTGPNVSSNEKILTIPNVTAAANGNYTLVVKTNAGCQSKPYTFNLGVKNIPQTPIIRGAATQTICEGKDLLLELENSYTGANVRFKWKTPAGDSTTSNPTFTISGVRSFHSGDYSVKVIVDACESNSSGTKKVIVNPIPEKPVITTNSPICEGNSIKLKTPQISGAFYEWTGPGFSSSIAEPIISNSSKDKEGTYRVRVLLNGCISPFSDAAEVIVNATPTQIPSVKNNGPICMDVNNPGILLSVDPASAIPGAVYSWYNTNNININGTPTAQLNFALSLAGYPKKDTTYEFFVIGSVNGCPSKASIPTIVTTNVIPNLQAFAGADIFVCDATSITLKAAAPTVGTGVWLQTDGSTVTIANPNSPNSAVNGLVAGQNYTLQWKLSNGACKDYAFDEIKISVNDTNLKADAGDSINICKATTAILNAKQLPTGTSGTWTQLVSQEQLGVKIKESSNPNSLISGLTPGNLYIFKWTISNAGCKDYSSDEVYVNVATTVGVAQTEADKLICGNSTPISAVPVAGVTGSWIATGGQEITSPNSNQTTVKNLQNGRNQLIWVLKNPVCGIYSRDTLNIDTEPLAIANADNIDVKYAGSTDVLVLKNDVIPASGYIITLASSPKYGKAKVSSDGSRIEYRAPNGYAGADEFTYELCNANCPDACTTAKILVNILGGDDCTIPTIITPNDDQVNDLWEIPCIAGGQYPNNSVAVFNQWGSEVYRSSPYKNDWQGTYNGKNLPEGTYFFVVDFGNGQKRNGFIMIER